MRCRGITTDIPNMLPASGAPTASPIIIFYDFSRVYHSSRELMGIAPWVSESGPNHENSRVFKNFPKIVNSSKNKSQQIGWESTLGYPRNTYASENESPTLWLRPTRFSKAVTARWVLGRRTLYLNFIKIE